MTFLILNQKLKTHEMTAEKWMVKEKGLECMRAPRRDSSSNLPPSETL
jgi:hypothetical protein